MNHCYHPRKARVFEEFSPGRHPLSLLWMAEEENIMLIVYLGQAVNSLFVKGNWVLIKDWMMVISPVDLTCGSRLDDV